MHFDALATALTYVSPTIFWQHAARLRRSPRCLVLPTRRRADGLTQQAPTAAALTL